jgi:two-component system, LytTR family, sensor kinase
MLTLALSALALCASIIRFAAQMQLFESALLPFRARNIALMEVGNWLAWTAWAYVLVHALRRIEGTERSTLGHAAAIIGLALAPILVVPMLASPVHLAVMGGSTLVQSGQHVISHNLPTNALLSSAMLAVALFQTSQRRARRLELTAAGLQTQLAESQLATLRTQMDPHFLFNALNGITVLARRGENAPIERMVAGLSALLRYSLDSAHQQLIPLHVELDLLRHYVDVETARFGSRLIVAWQVDPDVDKYLVPSFLLQPIVENAIRHGFEDGTRALHVDIDVHARDGSLEAIVEDDGVGLANREAMSKGIGLGNTRARLAGLFGRSASLSLEGGASGRGVRVVITLPATAATESLA